MIEKHILSTKECHELCGKEIIFDELVAIYGRRLLKPIRTMPNGSQNWSKAVVIATIQVAQSEGSLLDRPRVEAALRAMQASKPASKQVKALAETS